MEHKPVIIRRSLLGNFLFFGICIWFVVCSVWIFTSPEAEEPLRMHVDGERVPIPWLLAKVAGIILMIISCGASLIFFIFIARKPVAVISSKGITIPILWGENFIPWENIDRFEAVDPPRASTAVKYIGIFVHDTEGLLGAGVTSQKIFKRLTGHEKAPAACIMMELTSVKIDKAMEILQEFYNKYKPDKSYPGG